MLFNKAAVFGDLHLGKHSDSPVHNQDCLDYTQWFCDQARNADVDAIIFIGDLFDNRSRMRLDTLSVGNRVVDMLRQVAPVYMIPGNHDMFYRHTRDITSISGYDCWDNVTVHNDPIVVEGVGFVPFLVGTEYLDVINMDAKYLFGHFELPNFLMNSTIQMPDRGQFNANQLSGMEYIFSGHFHKRQLQVNSNKVPVWYIGSPFGHDFNDVGDQDRGMMILPYGGEPEFINYTDGPLYQRFSTSEIIDLLESGGISKVTRGSSILEIKDDLSLELEDISEIRDQLNELVRETRIYAGSVISEHTEDKQAVDMDGKPLTEIVTDHLLQIDPHGSDIDPSLLVSLFMGETK